MKSVADSLVEQFDRMVRRDGGELCLLGVEGGVVRVGYRVGVDPSCTDGSCVLPQVELQQLMGETLSRRDPALRVVVEAMP
jgi:hypothetical protein